MDYKSILVTRDAGIAVITLNCPDKLNALTVELLTELGVAIDEVGKDDDVRVVILTAEGKTFCAGANLQHPIFAVESPVQRYREMDLFHKLPLQLRSLPKPVIAAVNGVVVGAGANLALSCDMIIASDKARFGQVFVNIGLHVDTGGTYLLPRSVGVPKAMELLLTGDLVDATEAERIGMINKVVPEADLQRVTRELAEKLAAGPPVALALNKASIYCNLLGDLASALDREAYCQALILNSEDNKEGIGAFLEKRKPQFKGFKD